MTYDVTEKSVELGEPLECYRFTADAAVYRLTSADHPVVMDEESGQGTFQPESIIRTAPQYTDEDDSGTLQIELPSSSALAQLFVPFTPNTPIALKIFRRHYGDTDRIIAWSGSVVSAEFEEGKARLICQPMLSLATRVIPLVSYQAQCNWSLYSPQCGVDPAAYRQGATVSDVSGVTVTASNFGLHPDGYFTNGWIERADGSRRFIVDHVGSVVTLVSPFFGLVVTEVIDAYPGCDRLEATCSSKFNNLANHAGFPRIPQRNVFDKGLG